MKGKAVARKRILSGMRPTGKLHIGHYHGALKNWAALQDEYECFFFVADWHALTTEYSDPSIIPESTWEMLIDWLSIGLDPERSTIFIQSEVITHAELFVLLSMIVPLPWLERCPTYKEQMQEIKTRDLSTFGFLGYPVLQAADIIIYKAHKVPVGEDQLPHLELTREIARRFNNFYKEIFPVPDPILTEVSRLMGTDGRKMSKSYDNAVFLSDSDEEITQKILKMFTDPQRLRRKDPGRPEICAVYDYHQVYSDPEICKDIAPQCRTAEIGCVDCKKILIPNLIRSLEGYREKRSYWLEHSDEMKKILEDGITRAREISNRTMEEVREAVSLHTLDLKI